MSQVPVPTAPSVANTAAPIGATSPIPTLPGTSAVPVDGDGASPALDPNRIGVVFVHGIGTQPACETFLAWSRPIIDVLRQWRDEHGYHGDPVCRSEYDLSGQKLPILELEVPAHEDHPAQRWVLTEAWWAGVTVPPTVSSMTGYVSRALPRIIRGIREGYEIRVRSLHERQQRSLAAANAGEVRAPDLVAREVTRPRRWVWIDWLDSAQKNLTILAFGPALGLGIVALSGYALLRAVPVGFIRNLGVVKSTDNFLTRWFGELPDILDDPVQSANVRARLVNALRGLREEGCGRTIVVAHSGGAIVSFMTLLDQAYSDEQVDKLITHGEGLALAWRLEDADKGLPPGSRLAGNLVETRPGLRWADFWSSYDPAPAGPLKPPTDQVRLHDESHPAVNRMSILEDHGAYWQNDEEFVIPLLRHLDTPTSGVSESRFFRDYGLESVRLERRRQRVAVLALWRWIATLGALIPLALATITSLLGLRGLHGPERLGHDLTHWWGTVTMRDLFAGPIDAIARAAAWPGWLPTLGEWLLGATVVSVGFLILARVGIGRWEAWDLHERVEARKMELTPLSRSSWILTFVLLTLVAALGAVGVLAYLWR